MIWSVQLHCICGINSVFIDGVVFRFFFFREPRPFQLNLAQVVGGTWLLMELRMVTRSHASHDLRECRYIDIGIALQFYVSG